jgi:hypothetical protein
MTETMTQTQTEQQIQTLPAPVPAQPPPQPDSTLLLDVTNAALITRVLIGLALEGTDFLLTRLTAMQQAIDEERQQGTTQVTEPESRGVQMRYLAIGLLLRGERAAFEAAQTGFSAAAQTTGWFFGALNNATSSRFLRPVRQPFDQLMDRLVAEGQLSLAEGRVAEQDGRILADQIVNQVIDEFISYISDNPELASLVSDQIGQQGVTMTSTVVENARSVTVAGDNLLERLARRVLGRAPRIDLPPSPFVGKPQTMYSPETRYADESKSGTE